MLDRKGSAQTLGTTHKGACDFGMTLRHNAGKSLARVESGLEIGTVTVLGKKAKNSLAGRNR
jgi:hypothetical protein